MNEGRGKDPNHLSAASIPRPVKLTVLARWACVVVLAAAALTSREARAQQSDVSGVSTDLYAEPAPAYPPTNSYTTVADPEGLRAVLQLQVVFLTGFLYYVTTVGLAHDWDVQYSWDVFSRKITGRAFGADHNHFGTNFIGHPLGGTGYYLAARSNRLGIYQSFGFSFAGSLLWEYFGEVREVISMNDTLVTPWAGWAIGESMYQLGAFFDRSGPQTHNRVLASIFAPLKSANDWYDGLEPKRAAQGFPKDEWHLFDLEAGVGFVREDPRTGAPSVSTTEGRFRLSERLVRLPHFGEAGEDALTFGDANASGIEVEGSIGDAGLTDLFLSTQVVLGGYYSHAASRGGSGLWGGGGLIGVGVGFEYSFHDYERGVGGPVDRLSSVQPLVLVFEHQVHLGAARLRSYVDLGPNFGGIRSLAQSGYTGPQELLPEVAQSHGYYFGLGGHGNAALELTVGALELSTKLRGEAYRAVDSLDENIRVSIADTRSFAAARVGYRVPDSSAVLRASLERRERTSSTGDSHVHRGETTIGLAASAVF